MLVQLSKLSKSFLSIMKLKILKLDFAQAEESRRADTCKLGQVDFENFSKVAKRFNLVWDSGGAV